MDDVVEDQWSTAPRAERAQGADVEAVGLEATSCYGFCPEYTAIFCADGSAWYCGKAQVEPLGCFSGRLTPSEYRQLAAALDDIGFFDLLPAYYVTMTDSPSMLVLGIRDGDVKVVRDYAEGAPQRLWLVEMLLGTLIDRLEWTPIEAQEVDWRSCESG